MSYTPEPNKTRLDNLRWLDGYNHTPTEFSAINHQVKNEKINTHNKNPETHNKILTNVYVVLDRGSVGIDNNL